MDSTTIFITVMSIVAVLVIAWIAFLYFIFREPLPTKEQLDAHVASQSHFYRKPTSRKQRRQNRRDNERIARLASTR